jgi:hypothetical protein
MPRVRGEGAARIDYRHVIWSLVTKPGAFARYRYRGQLFPTLAFRRAYGRSGAMRDPPVCSFKGALLADYVAYLTEVRGLVATTVSGHLGTASRFLASLGDDQLAFRLSTLSPYDLEVFVRSAGQRYGRDTLSHVVANLRCFLCFLGIRGLAPARLDSHVDSPRTYRRERLPRSLPWETVRALLQSIDRRDAKGVRDHSDAVAHRHVRSSLLRDRRPRARRPRLAPAPDPRGTAEDRLGALPAAHRRGRDGARAVPTPGPTSVASTRGVPSRPSAFRALEADHGQRRLRLVGPS